jgi:(p)ppGpp synthase/HD superfamily hydrolase
MYSAARTFALAAHGGQSYGDRPYAYHLDAVAHIVAPWGEEAVTLAYLHDTVEDTDASLETIAARFGGAVAAGVALLTDAPGATRRERKAATHARLAAAGDGLRVALVVKTADRLANVRACVAERRHGLWAMYRGEHAAFRAAAHRAGLCDSLWTELDGLLAEDAFPTDA